MQDVADGTIIRNAQTGERRIRQGGQWVPLAGAQSPGSSAGPTPPGTTRMADGSLVTGPGPRGGAPQRIGGLSTQEQVLLAEARRAAAAQTPQLEDAERFARLQSEQDTGGLLAIPFARDIAGAFDPEVAQMNEITARLAPAQRQAGSGTMSDRDLALFLQAVPGAGRPEESNTAIIDRARAEGGRNILYSEFADRYARQYGTLNGVQEAWRQFYDPPPVREGSPQARPSLNVTAAQQRTLQRLNASGRNRDAVLGSRSNPRFPPPGFDVSSFPRGDWYVAPDGQLRQAGAAPARRGGSGADPLGIRGG